MNESERFWDKVDRSPDCWEWRSNRSRQGYGRFWLNRDWTLAHRYSYTEANGPIPDGLVIDHLCRNPACVRPDHMEAVTIGENTRRGDHPTAIMVRLNRCKRGHEFTPKNTYVTPNGRRQCRDCTAMRARRRYARFGRSIPGTQGLDNGAVICDAPLAPAPALPRTGR